jgi:TetR/AcrR family transcriptional regulator, transcriptional repressor for nem operon
MQHDANNGKVSLTKRGAGMARPREFDERAVLEAAVLCFWKQGYEATSVRDLVEHTGIAAASLYNAFGDKRALYEKALDHYVEVSIADRIRRCQSLPPLRALEAFFGEIVKRSLNDRDRKGCMLVNAALDGPPQDPAFRKVVAGALVSIEAFFQASISGSSRRLDHAVTAGRDPGAESSWCADGH